MKNLVTDLSTEDEIVSVSKSMIEFIHVVVR